RDLSRSVCILWHTSIADCQARRRDDRAKVRVFVDQRFALDLFSATAARTSVFNASALIVSPSRKSMARRVFPSRLELNSRAGSFSAAPLAKVIFTTLL